MLIFLAIGDAYGAGFEYAPMELIRSHNHLRGYIQHPRHRGIKPGMYTDDTQMSLAVAEALLHHQRPSPLEWAEHFVQAFKRDPREGYAQRFYDFLLTVQDGADFLERIKPHSDKSGAAMRSLPLGFLHTPEIVLEVTSEQARLTHDTPDGIRSAQAIALASHHFLHGGSLLGLRTSLQHHLGPGWFDWSGKVGATGMDSARAALTALCRHHSMAGLLQACVAYSGDVDTVAGLALGLAACSPEYERDLPSVLLRDLEDGAFGKGYLQDLDRALRKRFPC
ncbi:ADP-ribosylglycohydrolase family protein [bacterium]|nr:ADP-ribosylglycohydrolase family protein [bacterium]